MSDSRKVSKSHHQIYSLDVASLSERLDLSSDELLAGMATGRASVHGDHHLSAAPHHPVHDWSVLSYSLCLLVDDSVSRSTRSMSKLEDMLVRMLHPPCVHIVLCKVGQPAPRRKHGVSDAVNRCACDRNIPLTIRYAHDEFAVLQDAIQFLGNPATAHASARASCSLVVMRATESIADIDASTIAELVRLQIMTECDTAGQIAALTLVAGRELARQHQAKATPLGVWVFSHAAADRVGTFSTETEATNGPSIAPTLQRQPNVTSTWLATIVGESAYQRVLARTPSENNRERTQAQANGEPVPLSIVLCKPASSSSPRRTSVSTSNVDATPGLQLLHDELALDGIAAELYAIPTRISDDPRDADLEPISLAPLSPTAKASDRSPLLQLRASRPSTPRRGMPDPAFVIESTTLSEIDFRCDGSSDDEDGEEDAYSNPHAFLIEVNTSTDNDSSSAQDGGTEVSTEHGDEDGTGTELILALPEGVTRAPRGLDHSYLDDLELGEVDQWHERHERLQQYTHLPTAVTEITLEAVVSPTSKRKSSGATRSRSRHVSVLLSVRKQVPAIGYVILLTALCAVSSQGALLDLLNDVPPLLKLFWRMTGAAMAFAPLAVCARYRRGPRPRSAMTLRKTLLFVTCVTAYVVFNATFIVALTMTSIGHAYIFSNSHSLIMVIAKLVFRLPLSALEANGAMLGFSGALLTTLDPSAHAASSSADPVVDGTRSLQGDLIAFTGAFAGTVYLICAKRMRAALGVRMFLFLLTSSSSLLLLSILIWNRHTLGLELTMTGLTHPQTGLVGWVHHADIELYLVLLGSICGTMGFITSMKYFDPLVVSVTMLAEPMAAATIGVLAGVDSVPGWPTFVGGGVMIMGCIMVVLPARTTSETVNVAADLVKADAGARISANAPLPMSTALRSLSVKLRRRDRDRNDARATEKTSEQRAPIVSRSASYGSFR